MGSLKKLVITVSGRRYEARALKRALLKVVASSKEEVAHM